jgi:hypothetical protein
VLLYSHIITPRLKWIADFIGKEILGEAFQLTTNIEEFKNFTGPKINYSDETISDNEFRISCRSLSGSQLLLEKNITNQQIDCFEVNGHKAFFKSEGDLPFDIFAASFYLLSRYEEYLSHQKDSYGRYAHENSLAFKENFLYLPLVNVWLNDFKKALQTKYPSLTIGHSPFTFIPTYDIDIAYSYLHKGWRRSIGGIIKSFISGNWKAIKERLGVLKGRLQDPFDAYEWLHGIHWQYNLKPYYFFLVANKNGKYDKNVLPSKKPMEYLIQSHNQYNIGIHPSWQSGDDPEKLKHEILKLGHITGKQITSSRQHYIRFDLPQTFRQLINAGIEKDFSMGYGSINGFRASVASPFFWYDLEKEEQTNLLLYPFCFMDANSFFEQKFSAEQALEELKHYYKVVKSVNGTLITIWHNNFLGDNKLFEGWKEVYQKFLKEISTPG